MLSLHSAASPRERRRRRGVEAMASACERRLSVGGIGDARSSAAARSCCALSRNVGEDGATGDLRCAPAREEGLGEPNVFDAAFLWLDVCRGLWV